MNILWNLIYETDLSGNRVSGDLGEFRKAVFNGADVKILYSPHSPRQKVWWSRNCSSINVTSTGSTIHIAATFMEAADTYNYGEGIDFNREPFALEYHIYNTTGVRVIMKFNYQDRTLIADGSDILPMRWYVKDYQIIPPWLRVVDELRDEISEREGTDQAEQMRKVVET